MSLEFQNNKRPILKLPGLEVRGIDPELEVVKVDLEFLLAEEYDDRGEPGGMSGAVDFATDLFDPGTVSGFADMFVRVLEAVTRNPQVPIGDIDLLGDLERRELTPAHGLPEVPPKLWPELLADAWRSILTRWPVAREPAAQLSRPGRVVESCCPGVVRSRCGPGDLRGTGNASLDRIGGGDLVGDQSRSGFCACRSGLSARARRIHARRLPSLARFDCSDQPNSPTTLFPGWNSTTHTSPGG